MTIRFLVSMLNNNVNIKIRTRVNGLVFNLENVLSDDIKNDKGHYYDEAVVDDFYFWDGDFVITV